MQRAAPGVHLCWDSVLQAPDRDDKHSIRAAVGEITGFRQDHKEGRRFHFVGVNFRLHRFQAHRAFFDRFISNYPLCFFGIGTHFSDDWRNIFLILGGKLPRKSATNKLQSFMPACVPLTLWYNMIELRAAALIAHRLWQ